MFIVRLFFHNLNIETGCTISVRQITMLSIFLVLKVMMFVNDSPLTQQKALKLLQQTELEILKAASSMFAEHNIRWFLDGGTLLGAARHQGFIPWDDDIDIGMLREDYDKLLALPPSAFPHGISLHTTKNTPGYSAMFAKLYMDGTAFETQETRDAGCPQAIFVDIFPYDALANDPAISKKQRRSARLWQSVSYLRNSGTTVVPHKGVLGTVEKVGCRIAHHIIKSIFSKQGAVDARFNKAIELPASEASDLVLPFAWPNIDGYRVEEIFPTTTLSFNGIEFPVPKLWDQYLVRMYGNWRAIPKVEDRKTHLPLYLGFKNGLSWEGAE